MNESVERKVSVTGDEHDHHVRHSSRVWWVFAAIAMFYLLSEHSAHLFGILPYLLLLACPVMHIFMHRHHDHGPRDKEPRP